jgi:hypothetical protein
MTLVLALPPVAGCHKDPDVTTRVVTAYVPLSCAPSPSAFVSYDALGDFEPLATLPGHRLSDVGAPLVEITTEARELDVSAVANNASWLARGPVPPSGDVDLMILPQAVPCSLTGAIDGRTAPLLAPFGDRRVMIVGGTPTTSSTPQTFVARLDTGAVAPVAGGLLTLRAGATATAFGDGVLVAGGTATDGDGVQSNAEVYDSATDSFDQMIADLGGPRTQHGAVVLSTGQTLLVGGAGGDGKTLLDSMVVVDPSGKVIRQNIALLSDPRTNPTVLLLASGEVLVAGGQDATGPSPLLEWFTRDATGTAGGTQKIAAAAGEAFVALPSGGALAVIGIPQDANCSVSNVFVITPNHAVVPASKPVCLQLANPILFGSAGDMPVLWTGSPAVPWLQWQPWTQAFGPFVAPPTKIAAPTASPDPGLAVWLTPGATASDPFAFTALRFDVRGTYSSLTGPLFETTTADAAPTTGDSIAFDPAQGVTIPPQSSVFVTDRTYADASVDVVLANAVAPAVAMRDELGVEYDVGGAACPFEGASANLGTIHVERHAADVTWSAAGADGSAQGACPNAVSASARLSMGLRMLSTSGPAVVRSMTVTRLGSP